MKIALVTDAWTPQVNGVVRTLQAVTGELRRLGHMVRIISPDQFRSIPCPTYPEIRLALTHPANVAARIESFAPDAIHIATEGPLGIAARRYCLKANRLFTTAYHTQFPDYVARRTGLSPEFIWPFIRRFHAPAKRVMVSTPSVADILRRHGIENLAHWGRGVDLSLFSPAATPPALYAELPRPIQLYVGRIAVEKNLDAFLAADIAGSKVVVGDGPARANLAARYPDALFAGPKSGMELAGYYAGADVFVFPSLTDTFGLVMIEALACGTPVAAYPVTGPVDVLTDAAGAMHDDLASAIAEALRRDRGACVRHAAKFTWEASARQFLDALAPDELGDPLREAA